MQEGTREELTPDVCAIRSIAPDVLSRWSAPIILMVDGAESLTNQGMLAVALPSRREASTIRAIHLIGHPPSVGTWLQAFRNNQSKYYVDGKTSNFTEARLGIDPKALTNRGAWNWRVELRNCATTTVSQSIHTLL